MRASGPKPGAGKPRHWGAWPIGLLVAVGLAILIGLPAAGYYTYKTYDYIQHDNDFCVSCHLMADPFEAFNRSEHRGLGCKACHQPTLLGRSQMALTQVLEQPEELEQHAAVTDDICASCHVEGDPEKWRLIGRSAGHRVHLESSDQELAGIECVTCHSTSIHEFAATDDTCAESGCHTESQIHLGRMGDFAIGCATCHSFRVSVDPEVDLEEASDALRPKSEECLSCHVMRDMVELPPDDPHGGLCADCHNPHDQEVAEDASAGCGVVGCHDEPEEESEFHVGMTPSALAECASCHAAHSFKADGTDCKACHGDMADDRSDTSRPGPGVLGAGVGASPYLHLTIAAAVGAPRAPAAQEDPFRHSQHRSVDCLSCHSTTQGHGRVTVLTDANCQSCHHGPAPTGDCASCHASSDAALQQGYTLARPFDLSTGFVASRAVPFEHGAHASEACSTCHVEPPFLSAVAVDCESCHAEHHEPEANCASCHVQAPSEKHPVEAVHATCAGAGCHENPPIEGVPETRALCLTCHQDLADHRPERNCVSCHPISGWPS